MSERGADVGNAYAEGLKSGGQKMRLVTAFLFLALGGVVWGQEAGIPLPEGAVARLAVGQTAGIDFSADSKYIALAVSERVEVRNVETSQKVFSFFSVYPVGHFRLVSFSPDNHYLAACASTTLWVWETGSWHRVTMQGVGKPTAIAFSPNSEYLAIGIETHTKKEEVIEGTALPTVETRSYVMIFDTKKWQRRYLFVGRFPGIPGIELESVSLTSLSFSPDGSLLACGWEWEVILLDPITGKQLHILSGHSREVNSVAFSPDERLLASGSSDKTIKLWNVETGKCIRTLTGHADSVYSVAFSPDGRYLASGSWDKTIKLWDVGTGECIRTLEGHKGYVFSVLLPGREIPRLGVV